MDAPGAVTPAAYARLADPESLTLSDIDTSRQLRTDDELLRLIAAIHGVTLTETLTLSADEWTNHDFHVAEPYE